MVNVMATYFCYVGLEACGYKWLVSDTLAHKYLYE